MGLYEIGRKQFLCLFLKPLDGVKASQVIIIVIPFFHFIWCVELACMISNRSFFQASSCFSATCCHIELFFC
jgi:hypothetical protein